MSNGLYTVPEIGVMTDAGLDELLSYYLDTGNQEGINRVSREMDDRYDDAQARIEMEAEAAQEREIQAHYEMLESMGIYV